MLEFFLLCTFLEKYQKQFCRKVDLKKLLRLRGESLPPPQVCGRPPLALRNFFLTVFVSMQNEFEDFYLVLIFTGSLFQGIFWFRERCDLVILENTDIQRLVR